MTTVFGLQLKRFAIPENDDFKATCGEVLGLAVGRLLGLATGDLLGLADPELLDELLGLADCELLLIGGGVDAFKGDTLRPFTATEA